MKRLTSITALMILSVVSFAQDKKYKVEATEADFAARIQEVRAVREYLAQSNLPHQDVVKMVGSLDKLNEFIVSPILRQKAMEDSSKSKPITKK